MNKPYKITVKASFKEGLKLKLCGDGVERYPLYISITYMRKFTQFPMGLYMSEFEFANGVMSKEIASTLKLAERGLRFEVDNNLCHSVRGYSKRFNHYKSGLMSTLITIELEVLSLLLADVMTYKAMVQWKGEKRSDRLRLGKAALESTLDLSKIEGLNLIKSYSVAELNSNTLDVLLWSPKKAVDLGITSYIIKAGKDES